MPWTHLPLTQDHATFLSDHAVTSEVADAVGLYSITDVADLPEEFSWAGDRGVPAIVFPWKTPSGAEVNQLRPDFPVAVEGEKRARKYLWPAGSGSPIGEVRKASGDTVALVEGTKQSLAFAGYAPTDIGVYGIAGCRTWSEDGIPVTDLEVVEGKHVIIAFDADIETNLDVWQAANAFARALTAEGALDIKWLLVPGGQKVGLDDILGKRDPEKRSAYLDRLIAGVAKSLPKKPPAKRPTLNGLGTPERPLIQTNDDRHDVINAILNALGKWNGTRLFNYGGMISELKGTTVDPLNKDRFCSVLAEGATCAAMNSRGEISYGWPDPPTIGAAMTQADVFTDLVRVSRMPIVRPDGTVVSTSGYDEQTKTVVALPEDLEGLEVPGDPSAQEVADALALVTEDWLYDFMPSLPTQADKANLLGLMMTPLIRGLCPLVPLAVVDGLQAGVGKNLLADLLAILVTGETAQPLPYARDDEEVRKVITSAFRTGAELFLFDEAHVVEGANFARALTSITYKDRVLGVSTMAEYPNNVTWVSLGNQVTVNGDMSRRVYRIHLSTTVANPQDRSEVEFLHPDIRQWTLDNRSDIVAALLTLVRAWFAQGQRGPAEPVSFGSFERWAKIVGGVLHGAGFEGFLSNLIEWRSETDYERVYWSLHLQWLVDKFGLDKEFTTGSVQAKMFADPDAELPPRMKDTEGKHFPRELGQAYNRQKGKIIDGLMLSRSSGHGHGNVSKWAISAVIDPPTPNGPPTSVGNGSESQKSVGAGGDVGIDLVSLNARERYLASLISVDDAHMGGCQDSPTPNDPPTAEMLENLSRRKNTSARFIIANS